MERNFMGLAPVKQEIPEEPTDPAPARSSAMQWSSSNKTHPQHLSFKGSQDQNKPKTGFDSLASAGLVTITTAEAADSIHQPYCSVTQKNTMLTYPPHQIGAHSVQQSHEVRGLPVANQTHQISASTNHQPFTIPAGQNVISAVNPHSVRGGPISSPVSVVPARNGVVGSTELRGAPKTSTGPAQLTIFYAGSVCVYNNVSPEKAQAIMLLAGDSPSVIPSTPSTVSPVHTVPKSSSALDSFVVNKSNITTLPSNSNPIPMTSHRASQPIGVFNKTNEVTIINSNGGLKSLCCTAPHLLPSTPSNASPVQTILKSPALDSFVVNKCDITPPASNSSPIPMTTRGASPPSGVSDDSDDEVTIIKSVRVVKSPSSNTPCVTPSAPFTSSPVQPIPKAPLLDAFVVNQRHIVAPLSNISPIPITSRVASQSIGVSNNTNDVTIINSVGVLKSPPSTAHPTKMISFQESVSLSLNLSAVPQARKASLARFLEKRKERITGASPYANSKQTPEHSTTPGTSSWSMFLNSSSSSLLPASN